MGIESGSASAQAEQGTRIDRLGAFSQQDSLPEGFEPAYSPHDAVREDEKRDSHNEIPREQVSLGRNLVQLYKLWSILALGGILGTLARRGLTLLSSYNGAYISGSIWSNFTACVVMGIAVDSVEFWNHGSMASLYSSKSVIPMYTFVTTGFCGSLSTFSSIMLEMLEYAADLKPSGYSHYPNLAYGIMEFLSVLIAQISVSMAGLKLGKHLSQLVDDHLGAKMTLKIYKKVELMLVVLGTLAWIAVIVVSATVCNHRDWSLSGLIAPIGVYTRFYLSKTFNPKVKNFPFGTFLCNFIGTITLLVFYLLNRGKLTSGGRIVSSVTSCQALDSLSDGYSGCLSTMSTLAVELSSLPTWKGYRYGAVTVLVCFIVMLLIAGSYNWAVGFVIAVC